MKRRVFIRSAFLFSGGLLGGPSISDLWASTGNGTTWYVVKPGDTLSEIASARETSIAELKRLNGLRTDTIRAGQRLRVQPEWNLLKPVDLAVSGLSARRWRHIVVHHSATPSGNARVFDAYHRRVRNMENGLAYHFLIGNGLGARDGEIQIGPRWKRQLAGGHVANQTFNKNSLGICLVGNFERSRPTRRQMLALTELITCLGQDLLERNPKLVMHRELKGEHTLCPGKNFPAETLRSQLA